MRRPLKALVGAAVVLAATACSGSVQPGSTPSASGGAQQIAVSVGNSMQFAPASVVVRAGQPVELALRNGGGIAHDFALGEGASSVIKIEALGGQTARATFTIEAPGSYEFVCSVPGHAAAGMRGTITAVERSS